MYNDPTSERGSSRIQQDVALGNNINSINQQQTQLENQVKASVTSGIADNELETKKTIAAQFKMQQAQLDMEKARYQDRNDSERAEYASNIGAYGQDYQAEINNPQNDGDPSNDWKISYLNNARNQKIGAIEESKAKADQQNFENMLLLLKEVAYKTGKPYYKPTVQVVPKMKKKKL